MDTDNNTPAPDAGDGPLIDAILNAYDAANANGAVNDGAPDVDSFGDEPSSAFTVDDIDRLLLPPPSGEGESLNGEILPPWPSPVTFAMTGTAQSPLIAPILAHLRNYPDIATDASGRLCLLRENNLCVVDVEHLVAMAGGMRFSIYDEDGSQVDLRTGIAKAILKDPDPQGLIFPRVERIVPHPFVSRDGAIVDLQGYSASSKTFLCDGARAGADNGWSIPRNPTRTDALTALALYQNLVREFWFATETDRSVAISMLITACLPTPMRTRPLVYINAHSEGTGKSLLIELGEVLADGAPSRFRVDMGDETEGAEFRKAMVSQFVGGAHLVVMDNISKPVRSGLLERWLTSEQLSERILGGNAMFVGPPPFFVANGNNVKVNRDGARRGVFSNQNTNGVPVEMRKFSRSHGEMIAYVTAHRKEFICAAVTIIKHYIDQGRPVVDHIGMPSFEDWVDNVCCPLIYLGVPDPLANRMEAARAATMDTERSFGAFLLAAAAEFPVGSRPWTVRDMIVKASAADPENGSILRPDLHAAIAAVASDGFIGATPRLSSRYLGLFLAQAEDKPYTFDESLWPSGYTKEKPFVLRVTRSKIVTGNVAHWVITRSNDPEIVSPPPLSASIDPSETWLLPALDRIRREAAASPEGGSVRVGVTEVLHGSCVSGASRETQEARLAAIVRYATILFPAWKTEIAKKALPPTLIMWRKSTPPTADPASLSSAAPAPTSAPRPQPHVCCVCGDRAPYGSSSGSGPVKWYCGDHDPIIQRRRREQTAAGAASDDVNDDADD